MAILRLCSIPDCGKPACNGRGWCRSHYERVKRHGDPLAGGTPRGEPMSWLRDHIAFDGDQCLKWPFGTIPDGYGIVKHRGRAHAANHVMCELAHGEPPTAVHQAAHQCGNPICVNPKHLRWDTPKGNNADRVTHGTMVRGEQVKRSKLTEDQVRKIRDMKGVKRRREIAEMFGVSERTITSINQRNLWAWLD